VNPLSVCHARSLSIPTRTQRTIESTPTLSAQWLVLGTGRGRTVGAPQRPATAKAASEGQRPARRARVAQCRPAGSRRFEASSGLPGRRRHGARARGAPGGGGRMPLNGGRLSLRVGRASGCHSGPRRGAGQRAVRRWQAILPPGRTRAAVSSGPRPRVLDMTAASQQELTSRAYRTHMFTMLHIKGYLRTSSPSLGFAGG
jgi:hypothetical protein